MKIPELPKGIYKDRIRKKKNWVLVEASNQLKNFWFYWDGSSEYYTYIYQNYKSTNLNN